MRRLLILIAVLAPLLVIADRVGSRVAAGQVAAQIRTSQGLSAEPRVEIHGFPFLTQAIGGEYDDVDVEAAGLVKGSIKMSAVSASLEGVQISLGDALGGGSGIGAVPVRSARADATVGWDALENASGEPVRLSAARGGGVQVAATVSGQTLRFVTDALIEGGQLVLVPREVAGRTVHFGQVRLPFGLKLRSATVTPSGLVLHATGERLAIKL